MPIMAERPKFQFRTRDLLWAVSLMGMALGMALVCWREVSTMEHTPGIAENWHVILLSFTLAALCFGAGIGTLLRHPLLGAFSGIVIAFLGAFAISFAVGGMNRLF